VQTKVLIQAVKRNLTRFPEDFMFQLSAEEFAGLRSQIVTSNQGGRRYPPSAFTEHGVAMLSSVLGSPRSILVNIQIMRSFVRLGAGWPATRSRRASSTPSSGSTTPSSGRSSMPSAN
jgi:hypothetical protein